MIVSFAHIFVFSLAFLLCSGLAWSLFGDRFSFWQALQRKTKSARLIGLLLLTGISGSFIWTACHFVPQIYVVKDACDIQVMWVLGKNGVYTKQSGEAIPVNPQKNNSWVINESEDELVVEEITYSEEGKSVTPTYSDFPKTIAPGQIIRLKRRDIDYFFWKKPHSSIEGNGQLIQKKLYLHSERGMKKMRQVKKKPFGESIKILF